MALETKKMPIDTEVVPGLVLATKEKNWQLPPGAIQLSETLSTMTTSCDDMCDTICIPLPTPVVEWVVEFLTYHATEPVSVIAYPVKSLRMQRICASWDAKLVHRILDDGGMPRLRQVFVAATWFGAASLVDLLAAKIAAIVLQATSEDELRGWLSGDLSLPAEPEERDDVNEPVLTFPST